MDLKQIGGAENGLNRDVDGWQVPSPVELAKPAEPDTGTPHKNVLSVQSLHSFPYSTGHIYQQRSVSIIRCEGG